MLRKILVIGIILCIFSVPVKGESYGGYVYRARCSPQFMDNEPLTIDIQGCRTDTNGKPIREPVSVTVSIALTVNGSVEPSEEVYNITFTGSAKYNEVNLGRQEPGTYEIALKYEYANGHILRTTFSVMITPHPTPYWVLWHKNGQELVVEAEANVTISVYSYTGKTTELLDSVSDVKEYEYTITPNRNTISVYVEIEDEYGWLNGKASQKHRYDYTDNAEMERYDIITVSIVAGISILIIALLFISTRRRKSQ